jgi:hypothetical protein
MTTHHSGLARQTSFVHVAVIDRWCSPKFGLGASSSEKQFQYFISWRLHDELLDRPGTEFLQYFSSNSALIATPIAPPNHIHVYSICIMSSSMDGFVRVAGCQVAGVAVQKFKSSRTGLVVCLAQVEGPIVEGFFCLGEYCNELTGPP